MLTAIGGSPSVGGYASSLVRMTAYTREGHVDMMTHAGERVWMPGVLRAAGSRIDRTGIIGGLPLTEAMSGE